MVKQLLFVALGGGVGSCFRYLVSLYFFKKFTGAFPLGTFIVNVSGCLLIGFLAGIIAQNSTLDNNLRLLLIVGLCGGYTTFSTFSLENLRLFETGNYLTLTIYILASVIIGLLAVVAGNLLSKSLFS